MTGHDPASRYPDRIGILNLWMLLCVV